MQVVSYILFVRVCVCIVFQIVYSVVIDMIRSFAADCNDCIIDDLTFAGAVKPSLIGPWV